MAAVYKHYMYKRHNADAPIDRKGHFRQLSKSSSNDSSDGSEVSSGYFSPEEPGKKCSLRNLSLSSQSSLHDNYFQAAPSSGSSSTRDDDECHTMDIDVCESSSHLSRDLSSKVRSPNCAACRNHGLTKALKGHKRHCRFKDCQCTKCKLTFNRRKIMASSVKMTRELKQDMEQGHSCVTEPVTEDPKVLELDTPTTGAKNLEVKAYHSGAVEDWEEAFKSLWESHVQIMNDHYRLKIDYQKLSLAFASFEQHKQLPHRDLSGASAMPQLKAQSNGSPPTRSVDPSMLFSIPLRSWLATSDISNGPLFSPDSLGSKATSGDMSQTKWSSHRGGSPAKRSIPSPGSQNPNTIDVQSSSPESSKSVLSPDSQILSP